MNKLHQNQTAFVSLKFLIYSAIIALFVYSSYQVGRFYFDYYSIKNYTRNLFLDAHLKSTDEIRTAIKKKIKQLGTPIYDDEIRLVREKTFINLKIRYSEYLFIGDYRVSRFNFLIDETREFR